MTNFTKITSKAGYPSHVRYGSARKMLLNAAYGRDEQTRKILLAAAKVVGTGFLVAS